MAKTDKTPVATPDIDFSTWTDIQIGFAPYWNPKEGEGILATVINRDERNPNFVRYLMVAHRDTMCQRGPAKDAESVLVKKGETFTISDYFSLTEEFNLQLASGLDPVIYLEPLSKADTESGHQVWRWRMRVNEETGQKLKALRAQNAVRQIDASKVRPQLES